MFDRVEYWSDHTPARSILRLEATYSAHRIFVIELIADRTRKYGYYVLRGQWVVAGFDNSPDPRAIRLKYGKIGSEHAGELIPHLHRANKRELVLTGEMTFEAFADRLHENLTPGQ